MSTLAELRDLVELDLDDPSNDVFSTDDVDRGIQRALSDYNRANPERAVGTITLSADGREISLSSLGGLIRVVRVWWPYTSTDPEYPPEWVRFTEWGGTLYVISEDEPQNGDVVRVYYFKEHTIDGLAGESSTTVPAEDEEGIILGGGAYCAIQKARGAVGQAGVAAETPEHWLDWGLKRMDAFHQRLCEIRARELRKIDKRVPLWREGWEREGLEPWEVV